MAGQALADGHVKRIISTGETVLGNKIVYPVGRQRSQLSNSLSLLALQLLRIRILFLYC